MERSNWRSLISSDQQDQFVRALPVLGAVPVLFQPTQEDIRGGGGGRSDSVRPWDPTAVLIDLDGGLPCHEDQLRIAVPIEVLCDGWWPRF